jgi:hypothetical protein
MAWERKTLGMLAVGTASLGGGLWLTNPKMIWAVANGERQAITLLLAFTISLLLAGFPAGRVTGSYTDKTFVPLTFAMGGAYFIPLVVVAWSTGLSPAWPLCWTAAFALSFIGSWVGFILGAGLVFLLRKKGYEQ